MLSDVPARKDPLRHLASSCILSVECALFVLLATTEPIFDLPFETYVIGMAGLMVGVSMMARLILERWVNGDHYERTLKASDDIKANEGKLMLSYYRRTLILVFGYFVVSQALFCMGAPLWTGLSELVVRCVVDVLSVVLAQASSFLHHRLAV